MVAGEQNFFLLFHQKLWQKESNAAASWLRHFKILYFITYGISCIYFI